MTADQLRYDETSSALLLTIEGSVLTIICFFLVPPVSILHLPSVFFPCNIFISLYVSWMCVLSFLTYTFSDPRAASMLLKYPEITFLYFSFPFFTFYLSVVRYLGGKTPLPRVLDVISVSSSLGMPCYATLPCLIK